MKLNSCLGELEFDLNHIRDRAAKLLASSVGHFTDHSIAHSERVIGILDCLVDELMKRPRTDDPRDLQPLNELEAFILLAAAYLHDIGMHYTKETDDLMDIRAKHHEYTYEMIIDSVRKPGQAYDLVIPSEYVDDIALVARGHREVDIEGSTYTSHYDGLNLNVRVRLLSALLRIADELDITYRRVDMERLKISKIDSLSQMHWWKHYYVQGIGIAKGKVRVDFRLPISAFTQYRNIVPRAILKGIDEEYRELKDWLWNYDVRLNVPSDLNSHKCLKRPIAEMPDEVMAEMQAYSGVKELGRD